MAVAGHEGGLRLGDVGVMGDVLAPAGELVSVAAEKVAGVAKGGGFMGKVIVLKHVRGFDAGDPAELGVQGQGGQAVIGPILVE